MPQSVHPLSLTYLQIAPGERALLGSKCLLKTQDHVCALLFVKEASTDVPLFPKKGAGDGSGRAT